MPAPDLLIPSEWFAKADEDICAAELLLAHDGPLGIASFHVQQAVEKYLKGYLLSTGWSLDRTHDLEALIEEASARDRDFAPFLTTCQRITEYYIGKRSATLAKVTNSTDNEVILGEQRRFRPEICLKTFARVPSQNGGLNGYLH